MSSSFYAAGERYIRLFDNYKEIIFVDSRGNVISKDTHKDIWQLLNYIDTQDSFLHFIKRELQKAYNSGEFNCETVTDLLERMSLCPERKE